MSAAHASAEYHTLVSPASIPEAVILADRSVSNSTYGCGLYTTAIRGRDPRQYQHYFRRPAESVRKRPTRGIRRLWPLERSESVRKRPTRGIRRLWPLE